MPADVEVRADELLKHELAAAIGIRHEMHAHPQLGGEETRTAALIADHLPGRVDAVAEGLIASTGGDGPVIGIRAELDALPIQEESARSWRSQRAGVAHVCGHDVHTAALVAVSRAVARLDLPVGLAAVFQSREETVPAGAPDFLASEPLRRLDLRGMIGVHVQPELPAGVVSAVAGAINAAADDFHIRVEGRPAHGAYPHLSRDPIVAAAAVVQSLQHLVSRRLDPMSAGVVTVGRIVGGDSPNQVPSRVDMWGTLRSFGGGERTMMHEAIASIAEKVAEAHGCDARADVSSGNPVLDNDAWLTGLVAAALERDGFRSGPAFRSCGADDFAYYGEKYPAVMIFAGVGETGGPGLHHPQFAPDDRVVGDVARIMMTSFLAAARRVGSR